MMVMSEQECVSWRVVGAWPVDRWLRSGWVSGGLRVGGRESEDERREGVNACSQMDIKVEDKPMQAQAHAPSFAH